MYDAAGGQQGLERLAEARHGRVMDDAVVSRAFSHGFDPHHTVRLAAYWGEALGGPAGFTSQYEGHDVRRLALPEVGGSMSTLQSAALRSEARIALLDLDLGRFGDGMTLIAPLTRAGVGRGARRLG
nr:hypothetical protein [Nocardioides sp.]